MPARQDRPVCPPSSSPRRLSRSGWALAGAATLALASLSLAPVQAQVRLPSMGESVSASMPLGSERRLGDQIWSEVRRDTSYLDDPVLTDYLLGLWRPLVVAAMRRGDIGDDMRSQFAWQAFLIRDRSINAFALPGGYVGLHLGLIASTSYRDEMVSVMAHELSHVTQRHIARSMESSGRQSALGLAAILLGLIAASRSGNADMASAAIAGGQAAVIQGQLNFSRDMEREADRLGQSLMDAAGFEPGGMASMFEKLDKANRLNDAGNFPYLRTHPLSSERVAEAQTRAGLPDPSRLHADLEHDLMRARSRVLMDPAVDVLRSHIEALRAVPEQTAAPVPTAYAAALAAVQLKDPVATQQALRRLPDTLPDGAPGRWIRLLYSESLQAMPSIAASLGTRAAWAEPQGAAAGWSRPELALWGRMLLDRAKQGGKAAADAGELRQALRGWLVLHPADGALWELLADSEAARGNRLGMLRATAEVHLASGKLDSAILTLQAARQSVRTATDVDGVELAVIDARLADLRRQRVREMPEGRGQRGGPQGDRDERPEGGLSARAP